MQGVTESALHHIGQQLFEKHRRRHIVKYQPTLLGRAQQAILHHGRQGREGPAMAGGGMGVHTRYATLVQVTRGIGQLVARLAAPCTKGPVRYQPAPCP